MIIIYRSSTFHFDRISPHDAEDTEILNETQISQELHNYTASSRYNDTVDVFYIFYLLLFVHVVVVVVVVIIIIKFTHTTKTR